MEWFDLHKEVEVLAEETHGAEPEVEEVPPEADPAAGKTEQAGDDKEQTPAADGGEGGEGDEGDEGERESRSLAQSPAAAVRSPESRQRTPLSKPRPLIRTSGTPGRSLPQTAVMTGSGNRLIDKHVEEKLQQLQQRVS